MENIDSNKFVTYKDIEGFEYTFLKKAWEFLEEEPKEKLVTWDFVIMDLSKSNDKSK